MNKLRRKMVLSTWRAPKEGNIYGKLTVNVDVVLKYLAFLQEKTGEKVTMTHFAGRAIAEAMHRTPAINGFIRLGRFVPHNGVDVSFLVALEEGGNLANVKIKDAANKKVIDFARELRSVAHSLRKGEDEEFKKSQSTLRWMPTWMIDPCCGSSDGLPPRLGSRSKCWG